MLSMKKSFSKKEENKGTLVTGPAREVSSSPELLKKAEEYAKTEMPKFSKAFRRLADE